MDARRHLPEPPRTLTGQGRLYTYYVGLGLAKEEAARLALAMHERRQRESRCDSQPAAS